MCDSAVQTTEPLCLRMPSFPRHYLSCLFSVYHIIFSSVYHISILSVTCVFIEWLLHGFFFSKSLIPSVHTVGSRMDSSGLTRSHPSLSDASVWDLDILFKQSLYLAHADAIIYCSWSEMYCWWIHLFHGCVYDCMMLCLPVWYWKCLTEVTSFFLISDPYLIFLFLFQWRFQGQYHST